MSALQDIEEFFDLIMNFVETSIYGDANDSFDSLTIRMLASCDYDVVKLLIEGGLDVNCCDRDGFTAIIHAADEGNLNVLKLLHQSGANIHHVTNDGDNALMSAILGTGDYDTVRWLIEKGVDVNFCNKDGRTAVLYAAELGPLNVLKFLHRKGANIHQESIMSAIQGAGDYKTVTWLIKKGVDVNHCNEHNFTAVHFAAIKGNLKVLKLLHKNGANIHQVSSDGSNAILLASKETGECDTVRWLIEQGVDVNHCDDEGSSAVLWAANKGNLHLLKLLNMNGLDVQQVTSDGVNCIMAASIGTGDCETVRWLIEQGVDVNHCDDEHFSAVLWAAQVGNLDVLKLLFTEGANIHQVGGDGANSIISATQGTGDYDTVSWLIEQGVNVNYCDDDYFTAVHVAAEKGNLDVLKLLHEKGANIHQVSREGINSIMSASLAGGNCETVGWLIEKHVDVNYCTKEGFTAALFAAEEGQLDVLKLLHQNGANIDQVTNSGLNSIILASLGSGDCETVNWLIEQSVDKFHCTKKGATAIHYAARLNNIDLLEFFKNNDLKLTALDHLGNDALLWNTSMKGNEMTVKWLIQEGLDVNHSNIDGVCGLHFAAYFGTLPVIKMLCSMDANINAQDNHHRNALQFASFGSSTLETVQWLIENEIDVLNLNDDGNSALHFAAAQNQTEILEYIAKYDKRVSQQSNSG